MRSSKKGGDDSGAGVPLLANGSADAAAEGTPQAGEADGEAALGQRVELKFRAPRAGKYDLTLFCISGATRARPHGSPLFACRGTATSGAAQSHWKTSKPLILMASGMRI
jgi:hypothetical protein